MNKFITNEMMEVATIDLPETYSVGITFEKEYGGNVIGANVVVMKFLDGYHTVVHSKFHGVSET